MSYQIPQQLQYKEKIMFGMTFKQLSYFFIFALIDVIIFKRLGFSLVGIILMTFIALMGIMFIFFNLEKLIKEYLYYVRNRTVLKDTKQMQEILNIKEIKDDLIYTNKGNKIAVLRIYPINFSIKTEGEKDAIIYSFQKFLNSLDFSTQILMSTEAIKLDEYLNALKGKKEKKYASLFKEN